MTVTIIALQASPFLDPVPELSAPDRSSLAVDPFTFTGWSQVLSHEVDDYLLAPGDYRSWGLCPVKLASLDRRRTIKFADPGRKPWDRLSYEAIVGGFDFLAGAAGWVVHGLTVRGQASICSVRPGAERITFDSLLCEDIGQYGVRLFGNHNTVQKSVIRRTATTVDSVGVQIRVRGVPNVGNRILDCEIYDCGDSIQVTHDSAPGADPLLECRDLVVEGNDLYLTESRHVELPEGSYATAENAIDIKVGPRTTDEPNVFRGNRVWGLRCSAADSIFESDGAAVTIHRRAQRILFEDNVIFDCPLAFKGVPRDHDDPNQGAREVTVRANVVSQVCQYNPDDLGAVLRTPLAFRLESNVLSRCHTLSAMRFGQPGEYFEQNTLYDVPLGEAEPNFNAENNHALQANDMADVLLERRRWTQRDRVLLHRAVRKPTT